MVIFDVLIPKDQTVGIKLTYCSNKLHQMLSWSKWLQGKRISNNHALNRILPSILNEVCFFIFIFNFVCSVYLTFLSSFSSGNVHRYQAIGCMLLHTNHTVPYLTNTYIILYHGITVQTGPFQKCDVLLRYPLQDRRLSINGTDFHKTARPKPPFPYSKWIT